MTNYTFLSRSHFEHLHPWHIARKLKFQWELKKFKAYPRTDTQDFTITYQFIVSWISEGVNSVYRQKVPINAQKVDYISLGSRCVEQQPLQFYNIINKPVNLYKGKWMLHSVIFPDKKNGSCDFLIYSYYKSNSIQNSQYFISENNRQLVKQRQSFPCLWNVGIQG